MRSLSRTRWRAIARVHPAGSSGFTLIELTVAVAIIMVVFVSLLEAFIVSRQTVVLAKQRQVATGLANQVIEQLRGLPSNMVVDGVKIDVDLFADDDYITGSPGSYRLHVEEPTGVVIDEALQATNGTPSAPLDKHRKTTTLDRVDYDVRTYVTSANHADPVQYWLTAIVEWSSSVTHGATKMTMARSRLYSPPGCLSATGHPFSGPCQAYFAGAAGFDGGLITVTDSDGASGLLTLAELKQDFQIEQTASATGRVVTTGGRMVFGPTKRAAGAVAGGTAAYTDPAASNPTHTSDETAAQTWELVSLHNLFVRPTMADQGKSVSVVAAGSVFCKDLAGVKLQTIQPCSSGSMESTNSMGTDGGISYYLADFGLSLPIVSLASASDVSRAFTGRFAGAAGDYSAYCAGIGGADPTPGTSGDGCSVAAARRAIGTMMLGGLPLSNNLAAVDGLIRLYGYRDEVVAIVDANGKHRGSKATRQGVLEVWAGSSLYSRTDLSLVGDAGAEITAIPPTIAIYTTARGEVTVAVSVSDLRVGGARVDGPGGDSCISVVCTTSATVSSSLTATVTYRVSLDGLPAGSLTVLVDLGKLAATASYQAVAN